MTGIIRGHTGHTTPLVSDLGDGIHVNAVTLVDKDGNPTSAGGSGGSSSDRELVVTTYRVRTAFTGASVGDTITATQVIDVSGAPSTVSTIWRNQSTAADLALAPAAANLELAASLALTDAQIRATPLVVTPDAQGSGTREHVTSTIVRPAVGSASTSVALPALGASREIYVMPNTACFFLTGNSGVTATAATAHPLVAGERFYLRVPAGHTHLAVIRDTADGFITVCAVA